MTAPKTAQPTTGPETAPTAVSAASRHVRLERPAESSSEDGGAVAHLVLDRPEKRNALSLEMWQAIPPLVAQADADPAVKAIVVRGVDRTAFAAGADISRFHERFRDRDSALTYMNAVNGAAGALADCVKPAIALIHGDCVGGGVEIAIACDLRFCSSRSRFGITPARLGICYSMESTRRVSQAIGPSKTRDLLFSGRLIDAETACGWGLADRVYAPDELDRETAAFVEGMCRNSQYSVRFAKRALREIAAGAVEETEPLRELRLGAFEAGDLKEGIAAYMEKRKPDFRWNG